VDVFDLDRSLVQDYARFARSITQIRAFDISAQVEEIYATRQFWPEPLEQNLIRLHNRRG